MPSNTAPRVAILGAGNIGTAIARGLVRSGRFKPGRITLTRRKIHLLEPFAGEGYAVTRDNAAAAEGSQVIVLAVEPRQIMPLLAEIAPRLKQDRHVLVSVVSGVSLQEIAGAVGDGCPAVRAMPNIAAAIGESVTCVAFGKDGAPEEARSTVLSLFEAVGKTMVIDEEQMIAATALGACGIAFFLRAIRAASQGGIEVGFHSQDALTIAAQTARGAASLLLQSENHPESEIDRVTTPRGCTISGLNQMEHEGFSSAMIKGILTSRDKAAKLTQAGE
jgi:pyrroline-5-carboxylate reductase